MIKDRRLWILGPMLAGLVLLLSRGASENRPAPEPAPEGRATVAAADDRARTENAATAPSVEETEPRHPEIGFRSGERLLEHFRKHGREFGVKKSGDYLRLAQNLRERQRGIDLLEFVRNDAVTCKFDRVSGAFVAYDSDGTLRTFFRPSDGEAYFERQKSRAHEAP
ncbi:MAG: hypothetical protein ABIS67_06750 [Candidatus Eisenbacteria bacterium]